MSELTPQVAGNTAMATGTAQTFSTANGMDDVTTKLKQIWSSSQRNLVLSAVLAAIVAAIIVVALWSSSQSFRPLYSQQERFDIGEIVSVLESEGVSYRMQEQNGQVLVPEGEVAKVRMLLASKGVKAKLPTGLDSLKEDSSLGTSQFMETARYRHGLEGELVRTIMSLNSVANARVHLAIPRQTLFVRQNSENPSASVMLELKPGEDLKPEQVEAIINLVVGSVTAMKPEFVSVIDQYGRLLSADVASAEAGKVNAKYLEYQKSVEKQIIQRAADMLTPIVGPSNFRVQVAADLDFSQVEETQEILDNAPVVRNEHTIHNNSVDQIALGVPGSLSNQPPVTGSGEVETNDSQNTNARSEVNRQYAVGSSVRRTQYQQGQIEKLSVSVLLNSKASPDGVAWSEADKEQISNMIMDAVGISATRGDSLSLMSFNFTPIEIDAPPALPWWQDPTVQQPIRYVIGGLLGLAMIFFVLRPLIMHLTGVDKPVPELNFAEPQEEPDYENLQTREEREHEEVLDRRLSEKGISASSGLDVNSDMLPPAGSPLEIQLKHLQLIANEEPERVAEILKQWVNINEHSSIKADA
ncbi:MULTISPECIES: flagellar basal-body MS-ring/collar protein FliF [Vibrio]|uniref:Flagellar M-ring protein n=13 Tax=Vibrio TaxID=662 RepID=A0A0H0YDS4_VIBAL|nr:MULTISPECIES: flagellar basal-body MS-ring/collar protein FliF [Vibrio]EEZ84284.1 flagellar M-ring protein [Vibrio alginolyticus 40B]MDG2787116.1 flagellar basal-body MS-ring/collar protein FliF [Vibrio parahaemolyticus]MDW1807942.1 flagellar basal-body MS-ring/collar protein FliF [Vibrio sp. Vb2362]MDW1970635.1 flagellar basal-body MS-ring/collar protein FliF [Vibrio sp. 945]MDW2256310.1 flagellar basal-body MS-ring/collar protein FliF [Vibrio sp. 1409]NAW54807.1 flagellar M-ring protein 